MTVTYTPNLERQARLAAIIRRTLSRRTFMMLMKKQGVPKIRARRMWTGKSDMTFSGLCAVARWAGISPVDMYTEAVNH